MVVICIAIIFICNQLVVNNAKGKVFSGCHRDRVNDILKADV